MIKRQAIAFAALLLCTSAPVLAATYYFSDCQAGGAHASCQAGSNSNSAAAAQSPTTPWQTQAAIATHLGGIDNVPAGTVFLVARGGKWQDWQLFIENMLATPSSPVVFDSYAPSWGGTDKPWVECGSSACFQFGNAGSTAIDGGYTIRNLRMDGSNTSQNCIGIYDATRYGIVEDNEIHNCIIGIQSQQTRVATVRRNQFWQFRRNHIHNNREQGMLGAYDYTVVELNTFQNNAIDEPAGFGHNFYGGASEGSVNMTLRYNTFSGPGQESGTGCTNGNITIRGQVDGLLVEGNTISATSRGGGCYAISINPAYASSSPSEYCHDCVLRGNIIADGSGSGIEMSGAQNPLIENNLFISTGVLVSGIILPGRASEVGGIFDNTYDEADTGATIRNNACLFYNSVPANAVCIDVNGPQTAGTGLSVVGNYAYFASSATGTQRCWDHMALSNYTAWNGNLCFGSDEWSATYATHALAHAAGFDTWSTAGGLADNDPLVLTQPTSGNGYDCTLNASSPAVNVGGAGFSRRAIKSKSVIGLRDAGPCDR